MRRRSTHKRKRSQKGGSVSFLDAASLGYPTPDSLKDNMDLYTVACHGETTPDGYSFVVPPNTYFMFTAHSGEYAEGQDPSESSFVSYSGDKSTFYTKLYAQLFRPHSERSAFGPTYKESLYIYQPGDILPDYVLTFKNTFVFMFRHGVYKLPIETLSGGDTAKSMYLGRPLYFIKKALERGQLNAMDLVELNSRDKQYIMTKTDEELQGYDGVANTRRLFLTKIFDKIETLCCRGPDNLLFQPPFNAEKLKEDWYDIRLSTILNTLPKDPSKRDRFFFLNFCRVSYADMAEAYSETSNLTSGGPLLRSLSFSAKCGGTHGTDAAFNVFRVIELLCGFPLETKRKLVQYAPVRNCISVLKKGSGIPISRWTECLENTYQALNYNTRSELIGESLGYFTTEDLLFLSSFYTDLQDILRSSTDSDVQSACNLLSPSFETLYSQLQKQTVIFKARQEVKNTKIETVYGLIKDKFKPYRLPDFDFLNLRASAHEDLDKLIEHLSGDDYDDDIALVKTEMRDGELSTNETRREAIHDIFKLYTGTPAVPSNIELFSTPEEPNTSISFRNLRGQIERNRLRRREFREIRNVIDLVNFNNNNNNNNNNNTGKNQVPISTNAAKRKTRRRARRRI